MISSSGRQQDVQCMNKTRGKEVPVPNRQSSESKSKAIGLYSQSFSGDAERIHLRQLPELFSLWNQVKKSQELEYGNVSSLFEQGI